MSYKLVYDTNKCIGVGQCAQLSDLWSINNAGKAELKGAKEVSKGIFELDFSDSEYSLQLEVVESCPVSAIQILKVD